MEVRAGALEQQMLARSMMREDSAVLSQYIGRYASAQPVVV